MTVNWGKAIVAGLVGTAVLSAMGLWVAPMMGLPQGNPAAMLAAQMGDNMMVGWLAHFMIGSLLAVLYAMVARSIPGPFAVRGMLFSLAPWLVAMVVMMPMMGMPMFGGEAPVAIVSLIGHLVYGAVVGAIYGNPNVHNHV